MSPFGDGIWTHSAVSAYGAVRALSLIGTECNDACVCLYDDVYLQHKQRNQNVR